MKFTIQCTHRIDIVYQLHDKIFPNDDIPKLENAFHWLAYNEDGDPIGFAVLRELKGINKGTYFLSRAGVLKKYRGKGIHKRLIMVRERYIKREGGGTVVTYVSLDNPSSYASLIRRGYISYEPESKYCGKNYMYLKKEL